MVGRVVGNPETGLIWQLSCSNGHIYLPVPGTILTVPPAVRMPATLVCSLCLHARPGLASDAETVINGHAVCADHAGYVQGGSWSLALANVQAVEQRTGEHQ